MSFKISYFDVRGRAEPIRLIFEDLGVSYEDDLINIEQWPSRKPGFRFGQVPVIEADGQVIEESAAIYNFIARKFNLLPKTESELIAYDQTMSLLLTSSYELVLLFWNPEFEKLKEDMLNVKLPFRLKNLELHYQEKAKKPYWMDEKPMHCDYHAWHYLDTVRLFNDKVLSDYPGLTEFKNTFEKRPNIEAYLKSSRRPKRYTVHLAAFGGREDNWTPQ